MTALAFALLLDGLVVVTLLWTEVAPGPLRLIGWLFAALWWLVAAVLTLRDLPQIASSKGGTANQGLFVAAQTEYLRGNWIEAEANLRKLLRRNTRDIESQLLLATLRRRTLRFEEARQQLQQLSRLEAADRWKTEIRCERELLRRETERRRLDKIERQSDPVFSTSEPVGGSDIDNDKPDNACNEPDNPPIEPNDYEESGHDVTQHEEEAQHEHKTTHYEEDNRGRRAA